MTDTQFGILVAVIGTGLTAIGAAIKWSVGVLTKALESNTTAMVANSASNATLSTKIDSIARWIHTSPPRGISVLKTTKNEE